MDKLLLSGILTIRVSWALCFLLSIWVKKRKDVIWYAADFTRQHFHHPINFTGLFGGGLDAAQPCFPCCFLPAAVILHGCLFIFVFIMNENMQSSSQGTGMAAVVCAVVEFTNPFWWSDLPVMSRPTFPEPSRKSAAGLPRLCLCVCAVVHSAELGRS